MSKNSCRTLLYILYDRRGGFLGGALEWFQRSYIIVMPCLCITDATHALSHVNLYSYIRILQDYKCPTWYLTSAAEWSKALFHLSWRGVGSNPAWDIYIFILNCSIPACSEQLSGSHANEIKHDHSPVVIVVLDPRYYLSYKALYIYSRSIGLMYPLMYPLKYVSILHVLI